MSGRHKYLLCIAVKVINLKNQIIYISECQEAVTYVICTSSISICLPGEADDKLDSQTTWELDPALRRRRGRFTFTGYKSFLHLPFR